MRSFHLKPRNTFLPSHNFDETDIHFQTTNSSITVTVKKLNLYPKILCHLKNNEVFENKKKVKEV